MIASLDRVHVATRTTEGRPRLPAASTDPPATVHSCFRSALNIATPDGLLTIASESIGGLPNGIVADLGPDFRSLGITAGTAVEGGAGAVRFPEAGVRVDVSAARTWSSRIEPPPDGVPMAAARWRRRSPDARRTALEVAASGGLAGLLERASAADRSQPFDVTGRARASLTALSAALAVGDQTTAAARAHDLVGLGPGLTPSGDDLLVGLEAALHALGAPAAGFLAGALEDVDDRTTAVAATLLRHGARGEFAERIHRLLGALLGPADEAVPGAIARAVAWGATSGTDCLVGVLHGLDLAVRQEGRLHA